MTRTDQKVTSTLVLQSARCRLAKSLTQSQQRICFHQDRVDEGPRSISQGGNWRTISEITTSKNGLPLFNFTRKLPTSCGVTLTPVKSCARCFYHQSFQGIQFTGEPCFLLSAAFDELFQPILAFTNFAVPSPLESAVYRRTQSILSLVPT